MPARRLKQGALRLRHEGEAHIGFLPTETEHLELQDRKRFLRAAFEALKVNGIAGDYVEFGSASARTFRLAYSADRLAGTRRHFWSFDSYAGLPEQKARDAHPLWVPGTMSQSLDSFRQLCDQHGMAGSYTTVEGFYDKSLSPEAEGARPTDIAFAYVDCDLYSSTTDVLTFLRPRLRQGMIVAFDDYYCFGPSEASGERMALADLANAASEWRWIPYIQYGWHGMSFMVEDAKLITAPLPW